MSTVSDLKAEYDSAVAREKDLYTTWKSRESLIVFSAMGLAASTFKDHPSFDYIRLLIQEWNDTKNEYYNQMDATSAAFDRYSSANTAALEEAADVR